MAHGSFGHVLTVTAIENRPTSSVSGTSTVTLDAFASSAAGTVSGGAVTGTSARTLGNFTPSAAGTVAVTGTSARTLGSFTSTASGAVQVTGTSAQTLGNFTSTAAGIVGTYLLYDDFTSGTTASTPPWTIYNRPGDQANSEVNAVIPANVRVSGGSLLIDSKFEDVVSADTLPGTPDARTPATYHYTSGQIAQSTAPFFYGEVQVRAKLPGGIGLWPCIWLLGYLWQGSQPYTANTTVHNWPNGGWWEADIAEFMLDHRTVVNNALHFITSNRTGSGEKSLPFNATSRFMVYRLVWTPTSMTWYVDAEDGSGWRTTTTMTGTAGTDIPNTPAYLIIHTAVGGSAATTPDSSTFPLTFEVDYARILRTSDTIDVFQGIASPTLGAFTPSAAGTVSTPVSGTSARTLGSFTPSAAGRLDESGTSARTLGSFTSTATGTLNESGTSATTLGSFVGSAAGTSAPPGVTGTSAQTLGSFTPAASGSFIPAGGGVANPTLGNFIAAAAGTVTIGPITGTSAQTMVPFTSTAAGSLDESGSSAKTLGSFVPAGAGTFTPPAGTSGSAATILGNFIAAAAGAVTIAPITGTAARTLGPFTSTTITHPTIVIGHLRTRRGDLARTSRSVE